MEVGGGGVWSLGEIIYLTLHFHSQNDFCIRVDSDESHFNVVFIVKDKDMSTDHNISKRDESLPAQRLTVYPNRLTRGAENPGLSKTLYLKPRVVRMIQRLVLLEILPHGGHNAVS